MPDQGTFAQYGMEREYDQEIMGFRLGTLQKA